MASRELNWSLAPTWKRDATEDKRKKEKGYHREKMSFRYEAKVALNIF